MNLKNQRIEKLFRLMEGEHRIFPDFVPDMTNYWTNNLGTEKPSWWNNYRILLCGSLYITIEVEGSQDQRLSYDELMRVAEWLQEQQKLPNLWLCGSQSPFSIKYPYQGSDIDFFFIVPFKDLCLYSNKWHSILLNIQSNLLPQCPDLFQREVSCGLLAEELIGFPFLMDAMQIYPTVEDRVWHLEEDKILDLVEARWHHFIDNQQFYMGKVDSMLMTLDEVFGIQREDVAQIVTGARWDDVTLFTSNIFRRKNYK